MNTEQMKPRNIRQVLIFLHIIQEFSNRNIPMEKQKGSKFLTAHRLNPYNPLSYVTLVLTFVVGIIMFGIYGFWKETDLTNILNNDNENTNPNIN